MAFCYNTLPSHQELVTPAGTIRRNLLKNNVTTLFQLHFNVVPTSVARWNVA